MDDRIEHSVVIEAPLDRVWDLVTEPGWWVPSDEGTPIDRTPGAVAVRASERYGSYPVQVVRLQPKVYAAFRWASTAIRGRPHHGRVGVVLSGLSSVDIGIGSSAVELMPCTLAGGSLRTRWLGCGSPVSTPT